MLGVKQTTLIALYCTVCDNHSIAVSLRRQQIESFFSWINSKFHIQTASFVRSSTGLLFHVFANVAAAMLFKLFNS